MYCTFKQNALHSKCEPLYVHYNYLNYAVRSDCQGPLFTPTKESLWVWFKKK